MSTVMKLCMLNILKTERNFAVLVLKEFTWTLSWTLNSQLTILQFLKRVASEKKKDNTTAWRKRWIKKKEIHFQVSALLTATWPEARKVFETWNLLPTERRKDVTGVIELFDNYHCQKSGTKWRPSLRITRNNGARTAQEMYGKI